MRVAVGLELIEWMGSVSRRVKSALVKDADNLSVRLGSSKKGNRRVRASRKGLV